MSILKLTLPATIVPATGMQVNFVAPCSCTNITGLAFGDETTYTIVDSLGNSLVGTGCMWSEGALVSVLLDPTTNRAYLLNAAGSAVLSSSQYGDTLPEPGVPGRIFFKKVALSDE